MIHSLRQYGIGKKSPNQFVSLAERYYGRKLLLFKICVVEDAMLLQTSSWKL